MPFTTGPVQAPLWPFLSSTGRPNCISLQPAGLRPKHLLKNTRRILLCNFCSVCRALMCDPPLPNPTPLLPLTSILMRTRFIIHSWPGPLHTSVNAVDSRWVWMGASNHNTTHPPHPQTHTHWHTCHPEQITPLLLLQRSGVRSLCLTGVSPRSQRVNKQKNREK